MYFKWSYCNHNIYIYEVNAKKNLYLYLKKIAKPYEHPFGVGKLETSVKLK